MKPAAAPWIAAGVFFALYSTLAVVKYASFHTAVDLGIFTQALSSGTIALADAVEGGSHFAFHFSPILFLCVPILAIAHSPLALQIVQAFAGALVGPAVYAIAIRTLPHPTAVKLSCASLVYPPLAAVTFVDFHENAFVAPAVLWLVWAVLERRFAIATALAVVVLCIKEDEALILAFAATVTGAWALRESDRRLAVACGIAAVAALAVFTAYFTWLQPLAAGGRAWDPLRFYASGGRGTEHAVSYLSGARFGYVLEALYPLLLLPLFSKRFVYVLPGLAEDVLSRQSLPFSMNSHYPAVWIPWMLFAAIDGCAKVRSLAPARLGAIATASLAACVCVLALSSPTHWRHYLSWPSARDAMEQRRLDALPPGASVGTEDEIFSHLGFDPSARIGLGSPSSPPEYIVVDETRARDSFFVPALMQRVAEPGSGYALLDRANGLAVYRSH